MCKIYLFAIGGTGTRVVKSLMMLLCSGVAIDASSVVPVFIDPDNNSADYSRTVSMMRSYNNIRKRLDLTSSNKNRFFNTHIDELIPNYRMNVENSGDRKFSEFIGLNNMKDETGRFDSNYALTSMLFSRKNLDSGMDVGFKGNPNIGSVVLNQFSSSETFMQIASSFKQGDRIFIISSIFGGTGASGFPLLLKNLRGIDSSMPAYGLIKDAPIGAITVMPYFDVEISEESEIDSSTFISKTKSALSYYNSNINGSLNAMYYIADSLAAKYNNSEGGMTQCNNAHFIELVAAMSVIDFASIPDEDMITGNGKPQNTIYKEFGFKNDKEKLIFEDLEAGSQEMLRKPLTSFLFFANYINVHFDKAVGSMQWSKQIKIDRNFACQPFFNSDVRLIVNSYTEWLKEMSGNMRSFSPYELEERKKKIFHIVKGIPPKKVFSMKSDYDLFDIRLSRKSSSIKEDASSEQKFIELFYQTTSLLVDEKFDF